MKICLFCSEENPDNGKFCNNCGKPLTKEAAEQALQETAPSQTTKRVPKKHSCFVWGFAAIITVIVVYLFMSWLTGAI